MNILVLSWRGPGNPNAGGAEISTHEHVKGWVRAGHSVTLFTSYYKGAKRKEIIDGVFILREGHQSIGVQWEAFKWYLFGKHIKFDLVIDQFHGIPFFTPLYIKVKKIAFIHEVAKEVWKYNSWPKPFNLIPYIIGTLFEPLIFKVFYKNISFMTVSNSTKMDLEKWGIEEKNIFVIYNGVNESSLNIDKGKKKKTTITYLGAISKDKGIEDALKVFSILKQKSNDFQFWVIGKSDPDYLSYLSRLVKKLNIEDEIIFWGYVSEDKKNKFLARSHLLISPSIREGWGLVIIEAARVATPSIGYNVAGLRDSIVDGRTGILTKKNTPEEMAEEVVILMNDQNKYLWMSRNAQKWSKEFSWANSVKQSLVLIKKIYEK